MIKIDISGEPCSECGGKLERKFVTQTFERQGLTVKLSGIAALACSRCGMIYFLPGGADKVVEAANSLFDLAATEKQHKRMLTARLCRA